jgi:hypothetical protein
MCCIHDFHAINMVDEDIVLGYPWMELVGIVNINVKNKFLKLWYKKNKITMGPRTTSLDLKGFDYFLCSVFGEWFGLFLLILWIYFEIYLQIYSDMSSSHNFTQFKKQIVQIKAL